MSTIHEIDATGQSLGRMATRIATLLRGKDKATYEPRMLSDVKVVVHNLDKIVFKGTKTTSMIRHHYSGYHGGLYSATLGERWAKDKKEVLRRTVRGMLPENRSRDRLLRNLTVK